MNFVVLNDISVISTGQSAPQDSDAFSDVGIPFVRAGSLDKLLNGMDEYELELISEENAKKYKLKLFPKDTIVFAKSGMSALLGRVYQLKHPCFVVSHLATIIPNEEVFPNYLTFWFRYNPPSRLIENRSYPSIKTSAIQSLKIDLPPLPTQTHIAHVLDKADELRQKRQTAIKKLDELLQATFIKMFGDPVVNPMGWQIVCLSEIADYFNGLTYKPEHIDENGVVVLRSSNIQNSALDFNDIVRVNTKIKEKIFVKDHDILMCSRNGSAKLVGKVALIKNLIEPMTFGAFMMIIRSQEKYVHYLMSYFQSIAFRRQIATGATTTINQITSTMLDKVCLPLPSEKSLEHFTNIATHIETQKAKLQAQADELETLFLALQQKAFNGEITHD